MTVIINKPEVYIELTAAQDKFCLMEDNCSFKLVKGPFETKQQAKDWAAENGYSVNEYIDGVLQPK